MNDDTSEPSTIAKVSADGGLNAIEIQRAINQGMISLVASINRAVEQVAAYLARPDVQERLRTLVDASHNWSRQVEAIESPGYVPYFERQGSPSSTARLNAHYIRYFGWRHYQQYQDERVALKAFHVLARRPRWHPTLTRQVAMLKQHGPHLHVLDEAFRTAGGPDQKAAFVALLELTHAGDQAAGAELIATAGRIAPHAPSARGRPMRFETMLHRTFLAWIQDEGGPQAYTYTSLQDDFTDAATAATRLELHSPGFNPVASRRALMKAHRRSSRQTG